jgi:hypothetical protein
MKEQTEGEWLEGVHPDQDDAGFRAMEEAPVRIFQDSERFISTQLDHIFDRAQTYSIDDVLLTPEEISQMIKVPAKTVRKMLSREEIPGGFKVNGFWRLKLQDYRRWLDAR